LVRIFWSKLPEPPLYELFLKGLTSLFFFAVGKDQAPRDIIPCAVKLGLIEQKENKARQMT
jgi:hypothetical protein